MTQKFSAAQKSAVRELQEHIGLSDELDSLWRAVIAFESYPFQTAGRGKAHSGATFFRYTVSRKGGTGGRHYQGESIEGYGNELWIEVLAAGENRHFESSENRHFQFN